MTRTIKIVIILLISTMAHSQTSTQSTSFNGYNLRFHNWPSLIDYKISERKLLSEVRKCDEGLIYVEVPRDDSYSVSIYMMREDGLFRLYRTTVSDGSGFVKFDNVEDGLYVVAGSNGYGGFIQMYDIGVSKTRIYKQVKSALYVYSVRS